MEALLDFEHHYLSSYCLHGLCKWCRLTCKVCNNGCLCKCHREVARMKPSVGKIVHYVSYGTPGGEYQSVCRAALVTDVCDAPDGIDPETSKPCVSLAVFNPEGINFKQHLEYHKGDPADVETSPDAPDGLSYRAGTWHWPERVDG